MSFLAGFIAAVFFIASLFFLNFWRRSRHLLFAALALTFLLLAIGQGITGIWNLAPEERTWTYLIRLAAFLILIFAIVRKNVR